MEQVKPLIFDENARNMSERLLQAFFDTETINLRQIQKALYRMRLILMFAQSDTTGSPNNIVYDEFCVALILHAYDSDILRNLLRGELSDKDVVERLLPSTVKYDMNLRKERRWFETIVIRAAQEIAGKNQSIGEYDDTPLLRSYIKIVESTPDGSLDPTSERYFAGCLVEDVKNPPGSELFYPRGVPHRFRNAVKYLEMLEPLKYSGG